MEKEAGDVTAAVAEGSESSGRAVRRRGGRKEPSDESRKKKPAAEILVVADPRQAAVIKFLFNAFLAIYLMLYTGFMLRFLSMYETVEELLMCVIVTAPLVGGMLIAVPALRDFFVEAYAMEPAEGGSTLASDSDDK